MFPKYEYRHYPIYVREHLHQGNYPARFHKQLEIMLVQSSQLTVTLDGVSYTLYPGDMYIAFPNILHSIEADDAKAIVMIIDYENYPAFQDILMHNRPKQPVLRQGEAHKLVYDIIERMIYQTHKQARYTQDVLAGYANALLGELLGSLQLLERKTDSTLLQQLLLYIQDNYTQQISLDSIGRTLGYSKYHISRTIHDLFGCNLRTLINSYRISTAQYLLVSGTATIGQIALECGFKNQSTFNRIFMTQIGITPNCYRKKAELSPDLPAIYFRD